MCWVLLNPGSGEYTHKLTPDQALYEIEPAIKGLMLCGSVGNKFFFFGGIADKASESVGYLAKLSALRGFFFLNISFD